MGLESVPSRPEEFQDLERHDLLTGEPRYVEDEIRDSLFAAIFGILAALFMIVVIILTFILYYREPHRTFGWHGIWAIGIFLFALIAVAWGFSARKAVRTGRQPSAIFTGFIFIVGLILIGYLLIESIWLILYRRVHFGYLIGLRANLADWNLRMPNDDNFLEGWRADRKMIWWVVFFNLATAAALAFIVYAARAVIWNRYALTRFALYIALAFLVLGAWLTIYWVEEAYEYRRNLPNGFSGKLFEAAKAFAIVALVYAGINAIINLIQSRVGYFVMGVLGIILAIILIGIAGTILRDVRRGLRDDVYGNGQCASTMFSIHEKDYDNFCPYGGKYLAAGDSCLKEYLVYRWEGNNDRELRYLNPRCCNNSKWFYLYPFALVGFWMLVMIYSLFIAIASNMYLADSNDYLAAANRRIGAADILGLLLIFGLLIAFGIYFLARKANSLTNPANPFIASYFDPEGNRVNDYEIVPKEAQASVLADNIFRASEDGCIAYNLTANNTRLFFSTDASVAGCNDTSQCISRLAILSTDSSIRVPVTGGAIAGANLSRENFFPGCTGVNSDYIFYYGTVDQLNTLLTNLRFCPRQSNIDNAPIFLKYDQVNRSNLTLNATTGQLFSEANRTSITFTPNNLANCGNGFTDGTGRTCVGKCDYSLTPRRAVFNYVLKGRFFNIRPNTNTITYDIHNRVFVSLFNGNDRINGNYTLLRDGLWIFERVPRFSDTAYVLTVVITDPTNVYLEKRVDILIPRYAGVDDEISAGEIRLISANANICNPSDASCLNNQTRLNGNIIAEVRDGSAVGSSSVSGPLEGAQVAISRFHQPNRTAIRTQVTNSSGLTTFTSLQYDSYTLTATKTGFKPVFRFIDLQSSELRATPLIARPTFDNYDIRVTAVIEERDVDFDLLVQIENEKLQRCTVSPYSRFCPYMSHISDLAFGVGEENVIVKRLAVANYMAWVAPAPAYNRNCPVGVEVQSYQGLYHAQVWNWTEFSKTRPLYTLDIFTFIFPGGFPALIDGSGRDLTEFRRLAPVESDAEAGRCKIIIAINGQEDNGGRCRDTFFRENRTIDNGNGFVPILPGINGTVLTFNFSNQNATFGNITLTGFNYTNDTERATNVINLTTNFTAFVNGTNQTTNFSTNTSTGRDGVNGVAFTNSTIILNPNLTNITAFNTTGNYSDNQGNNTTLNITYVQVLNPPNTSLPNVTIYNFSNLTNSNNSSLIRNFSNFSINTTYNNGTSVNISNATTTLIIPGQFNTTFFNNCTFRIILNGSTEHDCNFSNITTFQNGTIVYDNATSDNVTSPNNTGANLSIYTDRNGTNFSTNVWTGGLFDEYVQQLPGGSNVTRRNVSVFANNQSNFTNNSTNYSMTIDVNGTNFTSNVSFSMQNLTNGTNFSVGMFNISSRTNTGFNFSNESGFNVTKTLDNNSSTNTSNYTRNYSNNASVAINVTINQTNNSSNWNATLNRSRNHSFNSTRIMNINNSSNLSNHSYEIFDSYVNNDTRVNFTLIVSNNVTGNSSHFFNNSTNLSSSNNGTTNFTNVSNLTRTYYNNQGVNFSNDNETLRFSNMSYFNGSIVIVANVTRNKDYNNSTSRIYNNTSENFSRVIGSFNGTIDNYTMNTTFYNESLDGVDPNAQENGTIIVRNHTSSGNRVNNYSLLNYTVRRAATNSTGNLSEYNLNVSMNNSSFPTNYTLAIKIVAKNFSHDNGATANVTTVSINNTTNNSTASMIFNNTTTITVTKETNGTFTRTAVLNLRNTTAFKANDTTVAITQTITYKSWNYNNVGEGDSATTSKRSTQTVVTTTTSTGAAGSTTTTTDDVNRRRRILMAEPVHQQAGGDPSLEIVPSINGGQFIFVGCFTGYGAASIVQVNTIVASEPQMQQCKNILARQRPNFTIDRLRARVNDFKASRA